MLPPVCSCYCSSIKGAFIRRFWQNHPKLVSINCNGYLNHDYEVIGPALMFGSFYLKNSFLSIKWLDYFLSIKWLDLLLNLLESHAVRNEITTWRGNDFISGFDKSVKFFYLFAIISTVLADLHRHTIVGKIYSNLW